MESFETLFLATKKSLNNIRGIFERENIEKKLKEFEVISSKENFWKDKNLVKKTVKQKKIFEDIFNTYKRSIKELDNLNDLYLLASEEKDDETIQDCSKKIVQILKESKKVKSIVFYQVKMMTMIFI